MPLIKYNKSGFSIIEILVVIMILGIVMSIGFPKFLVSSSNESKKFISQINKLVQTGVQAAIESNNIQKIVFNLTAKQIEAVDTKTNNVVARISIPQDIEITDFYVNNQNKLTENISSQKIAWFFINPDGITQKVNISFANSQDSNSSARYDINLNPFSAQFRLV